MATADAIVVGGGPAGLASAIALARRGLAVVVLERHGPSPDKACGEGLLPPALRALDELGVAVGGHAFDRIRYVDARGVVAEGRLDGRVVRRPALVAALEARAREVGVDLRPGVAVRGHAIGRRGVEVATDDGPVSGQLLVAADGLHSPVRRAAGLERAPRGPRRFGLRQHFRVPPGSGAVEVHFADDVEAYVGPLAEDAVGVTFLWDAARIDGAPTIGALLARFPAIAARVAGAEALSRPRGAGPLEQRASSVIADRLVLVGDAAGYVDAITGEGLSIALGAALALADVAPAAIARGGGRRALAPYARRHAAMFRRYAAITRGVLALARHAEMRRRVLRLMARHPRLMDRLIEAAVA